MSRFALDTNAVQIKKNEKTGTLKNKPTVPFG